MDRHGIEHLAALWREGQRAFWSAAAGCPSADTMAEAPEPAAFEGFWAELCGSAVPPGGGESWRALAEAAMRYRAVVLAAWRRIHGTFEVQRRAMLDPAGPPPDW